MNNRTKGLLIGAVAVTALLAIVLLRVFQDVPAPRERRQAATPSETDDAPRRAREPGRTPANVPLKRASAQPGAGDEGEGNRVVRDHRGQGKPVADEDRPMSAQTVTDVRMDVRTMVKDCAKPIRARDHRIRAQLAMVITMSASGGWLDINDAEMHLSGVEDDEFLECVKRAVVGAKIQGAEGQKDLEETKLTLSFAVP